MKIGIIGAMSAEVAALKSKMKLAGTKRRAGMEFCEGTIGNTDVVIVQSGVGKVNAGCCVQILADLFDVTHIINTGVAGSLNNDINIGDIVVSTDALYHDVDATVFGYAKGEVPQLGTASFTADEMLRASAVRAIREADPDIQVFEGRVASGDQFICDRAVKKGNCQVSSPLITWSTISITEPPQSMVSRVFREAGTGFLLILRYAVVAIA